MTITKKINEIATTVRKEGSKKTTEERKELEEAFLKRL